MTTFLTALAVVVVLVSGLVWFGLHKFASGPRHKGPLHLSARELEILQRFAVTADAARTHLVLYALAYNRPPITDAFMRRVREIWGDRFGEPLADWGTEFDALERAGVIHRWSPTADGYAFEPSNAWLKQREVAA